MTARKVKLSVTVSEDVVARIDEEVRRSAGSTTRSAVVDAWLRVGSRQRAADQLREDTARYYRERTPEQREDDESWSELATREFEQPRRRVR